MGKQKKHRRFWTFVLVFAAAVAALLGHAPGSRAKNIKTVGNVHISCTVPGEQESTENGEIQYLNPGEKIEKNLEIHVEKGSDIAYLRVKVLLSGGNAAQQKDLLENMETDGLWYYCREDGYFYYQKPVCEGDTALFPAAVYVPEQWSGLEENICFRLNLLVEAAEETYLELCSVGGSVFGWELK